MKIKPEDLVINTWNRGRRGGWSVDIDRGISIQHKPTGVIVQCDIERSQHLNRIECMRMMQAKLDAMKVVDTKMNVSMNTPAFPLYEDAISVIEDLIRWIPQAEPNCSCHINPPCSDCVENNVTRTSIEMARELVNRLKATVLISPK